MSNNIVKTPSLGARRKAGSGILNTNEFKEIEFGDGFTIEFVEIPQPNPHDLKMPMKSHTVMHVSVSGIDAGDIDLTDYATKAWAAAMATTISGDIVAQIPEGGGSVTSEQLATTSGDIVSQIPDISALSLVMTMVAPPVASGTVGEDMVNYSACYFNTSDKKFYKAKNNGTIAEANAEYINISGLFYRSVNVNYSLTGDPTAENFPVFLGTDGGYTLEAPTASGTHVKQVGYITGVDGFYFFGMMTGYTNS